MTHELTIIGGGGGGGGSRGVGAYDGGNIRDDELDPACGPAASRFLGVPHSAVGRFVVIEALWNCKSAVETRNIIQTSSHPFFLLWLAHSMSQSIICICLLYCYCSQQEN
jgi:hypothetical protein